MQVVFVVASFDVQFVAYRTSLPSAIGASPVCGAVVAQYRVAVDALVLTIGPCVAPFARYAVVVIRSVARLLSPPLRRRLTCGVGLVFGVPSAAAVNEAVEPRASGPLGKQRPLVRTRIVKLNAADGTSIGTSGGEGSN